MPSEKLSQSLEHLLESCPQEGLSIESLIQKIGINSEALIVFIISAAFSFPLPLLGIATPFGLLLMFVGFWMILGKDLWLPNWLLVKKISLATLEKIIQKAMGLFSKLEWVIHPRLELLCRNFFFKKLNGVLIFILSFFLALPLPVPFANVIAAFPILLISLGILEKDGLFILFGYAGFILSLSAFWTIIYLLV